MDGRFIWIAGALAAAAIVAGLAYATYWLLGVPGLAFWFVVVCVIMMLVILIQKPKGGGLSGAFGGAGGGSAQAAFGAKIGDVLTWFTVGCFVMFLALAMGLQWTIRPEHQRLQRDLANGTSQSPVEQATDRLPLTPDGDESSANGAALPVDAGMAPATDQPVESPDLRDAMEAGQENVSQLNDPTPLIPPSDGPQSTDTAPAAGE